MKSNRANQDRVNIHQVLCNIMQPRWKRFILDDPFHFD